MYRYILQVLIHNHQTGQVPIQRMENREERFTIRNQTAKASYFRKSQKARGIVSGLRADVVLSSKHHPKADL